MKKYLKSIILLCVVTFAAINVNAQYYQLANQLPGLLRPALSGSLNYKGFIDVSYLQGLGKNNVNFVEVSTSQGFRYASWFYMGVGFGVDVAMSHRNENYGAGWVGNPYQNYGTETTGVMLPIFTDFRFNVGGATKPAFFADIRLGASFLVGDRYLAVGDGFITNREYFYLKPSLGIRIPVNKSTGKQAIDIGVTYQLLTTNYWYNSLGNTTLNALGVIASFEW